MGGVMKDDEKLNRALCKPGSKVFYWEPQHAWAVGIVEADDGKSFTVKGADYSATKVDALQTIAKLADNKLWPVRDDVLDEDVDDLLQLTVLHDSTIQRCLFIRYMKDTVYTNIGAIVVALNPWNFKIPKYMDTKMPDYLAEGEFIRNNVPHSWAQAHNTWNELRRDTSDQCILISGESGAGKTETAKTLIDYLGKMSASNSCNQMQKELAGSVNKKLKASNPILESFGNAKTCRNDNSSRFGKYIKLFFDKESGILIGAEMVHYLLEKSRIVTQNEGERGYHVFYEILAGFTPEQKEKYGKLTKAEDYECLRKGNQLIRELNGRITEDTSEYKHLMQAFKDTGITDEEQDSIFRVLGAILNLQNVTYDTDDSSGKAKIANPELVDRAAGLLKVDPEKFKEALLVKTRTKIMTQMADVTEAQDMRDALSKALYSGVFDWLVEKLNVIIAPNKATMPKEVRYIGLLDIFGFENFKINSFEQFCINYTNESLQNHYNKYTFIMDSEECEAEGIKCPIVDYPDNQPCLDMLQAKGGVMSLLDAECAFKLGTDGSFTEKTWGAHGESQYFVKPRSSVPEKFGVNHYAATVTYMTKGWLEKNSDTLKDDMREVCNASPDAFVAGLLGPIVEEKQGQKKPTVSSKFKQQLESLKTELNSTDSHFIRTVKPNPQMKPGFLANGYVMKQLTSAGVIETIIMKRAGYPVRQLHREFWMRYRIIAPKAVRDKFPPGTHPKDEELREVCRDIAEFWCYILHALKPNYDIGHTKVFTKAKVNEGLEICRNRKIRRLLPRCFPFLIRWAIAFKKKKAEEAERLRLEQERIRKAAEEAAARRAAGEVDEEADKMEAEKGKLFTKMCNLFPHFDLPVINNVVMNAVTEKQATGFLLDMQKQRVAEALPVTVKAMLEEANVRTNTQEELIKRGITDRDKLYTITSEQMSDMGFTTEERDNLAAVLLHQQSTWIVNQRLNLLMGAGDRDDDQIKRDMEMLEKAAEEIKRDLEGHLAGKHVGQNITIRSTRKSPPPPEEQVARFVSMGFTREKAVQALKKAKNDQQKACDLLLGGQ
eukprot:TRINITY_DN814_c0_g2_i2.p2 TRINITY_DN814_c0_g2~~TRINITY_DN814_c0_g2_i2.p2  ORF type:complete len:1058 (+),score=541.61 TRINITY_DN814_c0_g2_i2:163-3336(+)